ncbi:MAG: undecaprenyl-phosphate glucose phosphotransferase [Burkholderiaceae bacterium]
MPSPSTRPRAFSTTPTSITSAIGALLEPAVAIAVFLAVTLILSQPIVRQDVVLALFVVALTFPGRNRFWDRPLNAAVDIAFSWLSLLAILALCGWATDSFGLFDPAVLAWWALLTPALLWIVTYAGRQVLRRHAARPEYRRRAIVVGAGAAGARVAQALRAHSGNGVDLAGYFDDRQDDRVHEQARGQVLGRLADAAGYVRAHGVHHVYITLPLGSQPRIVELMEALQDTTASIYYVPDVFGISIIQGRLQDIHGVPVVCLCDTPFTGSHLLMKRASDIVLASAILLLIWPLMLAIAIGVRLSSPGPVIFRQRRNGLDGDEIVVWKFRSMRTQDDGPVVQQATRGDPRITPFGAFLRRTSLDELPQFINVLQGRMSIVGPRPHAVAHNEEYRRLIKAYMVRHKVRPGITGWAQIHGHRGETDTLDKMQARVEYDLSYLRNWSLLMDLQIIARTIKLVFFDRKAY